MPWKPGDAKAKTKKADTKKKQRQWSDIADSVLERTGDEGLAIREANGVAKREYRGKGETRHNAKGRTGKTRSWSGK